MGLMGLLLVLGVVLALRWVGTPYRPSRPMDDPAQAPAGAGSAPSVGEVARRFLRGVVIGVAAGFWAGVLVAGPAVRLIMRLLAVTAGDDAQGRLTEASEVVGKITIEGTLALIIFGGILPGMTSGVIYMAIRRWLPGHRLTGATFGLLLLIAAGTRLDPLRPDNEDFDIVGPGWLSVATFGLTAIVHGVAVSSFAHRLSQRIPPPSGRRSDYRVALLLLPPALLMIPLVATLLPIVAALVVVLIASRSRRLRELAAGRRVDIAGRVALAVVALVLLPGLVVDLAHIVSR